METYRATSETIACTLSPAELRDTQAAWQKLFRLSLISRQVVPGGLRLVVHEGSAEALRRLVEIERDCCAWITFELDGPSVTMTGAGPAASAIREVWVVEE